MSLCELSFSLKLPSSAPELVILQALYGAVEDQAVAVLRGLKDKDVLEISCRKASDMVSELQGVRTLLNVQDALHFECESLTWPLLGPFVKPAVSMTELA